MRVCLLGRHFDLRGAGVGRVSMELLNGLRKRGCEVRTVSTNRDSIYSYFFYTAFLVPAKLPKNVDVYHALTPMEAVWLPKGRSVVTFHDLFQLTNPNSIGAGISDGWRNVVGRRYFREAAKKATQCRWMVAVSEKTKADLLEHFEVPEVKVKVIRSGIHDDLMPFPRRDEMFRVGYLGQLDKRKRVDLLIEAFRESELDELVISGLGLEKEALERQAFGDARIKFMGLIPNEQLADFYNSLDLFVFPTAVEGYGLPPVEAMACRKPVVVLRDAIIPDEIKSRCIVVDLLEDILCDRNFLEEAIKGVDYDGNYAFAKGHSWDKCVEEYIKLYEEVIKNG